MFNNNTLFFSGWNVPSTGQMTDAQGNLLHLRRAHIWPLSSSSSMQLIICVIAKIWRLRRRDTFVCDWGRTHFDCEWISHGWCTFKMSEGGRGGKENRMLINKLIFLCAADDSVGLALSWNGVKNRYKWLTIAYACMRSAAWHGSFGWAGKYSARGWKGFPHHLLFTYSHKSHNTPELFVYRPCRACITLG